MNNDFRIGNLEDSDNPDIDEARLDGYLKGRQDEQALNEVEKLRKRIEELEEKEDEDKPGKQQVLNLTENLVDDEK